MYYTDIYNTKLLISFFWRNISIEKYDLEVYLDPLDMFFT